MTDINFILPGDEMLNKGYEDLFHPSFELVGEVLREVISVPCSVLLIGTKYIKREVLKKLYEKINGIPEEDRIPIIPELGIPLLRNLSYYSNGILSDMFMELLAKSANRNTVNDVFPSYINIIENLSVDEALILEYIYGKAKDWDNLTLFRIPCISYNIKLTDEKNKGNFITYFRHLSELYSINNLSSIENIPLYIENLISLGVLDIPFGKYIPDENQYNTLESNLRSRLPQYFNNLESELKGLGDFGKLETKKEMIELTNLGRNFLSATHSKD